MKSNEDSVYQLVTELCEKFVPDRDKIQKSRSKCYEILLGKTYPKQIKLHEDLKGTTDPICNLISWQFTLSYEYDLKEESNELKEVTDVVKACYGNNEEDFKNILQFLLSLRKVPTNDEKKLDLASLPNINIQTNYTNIFHLPESIANEWKGHNEITKLKEQSTRLGLVDKTVSATYCSNKVAEMEVLGDEGYFSPTTNDRGDDIWELAAKLEYSDRKTWEDFGYPEPDKELPFLSELGDLSSLWVENLPSLYFVKMFKDGNIMRSNVKSQKTFVKDVKYLLIGMVSDTFGINEFGEFYLTPAVTVDGITPASLEYYCNDLIFCGTCFKALEKISSPDPQTGNYAYQGYIFSELCKSINRYLQFYRTATLSIPDSTPMLTLHEKSNPLRLQIITLTSICKIGPYSETENIPHTVALLNYLYQRILTLTDHNLHMVLYSILYPCCQVYFSRFLKQWILEGSINDPYGEFFIKLNYKYINTRARIYWTRTYSLREDIVPDFLLDLKMDILSCGKIMNLLKLCVPGNKLCVYLMGKKPPIISCCLNSEQLTELRHSTTNYYLEVCADCGLKFNISEFCLRDKQIDPAYLNLIAKKRSVTLKRLELERKKQMTEVNDKRNEELQMLKEQYDAALESKQSKIAVEIEKEMKVAQENAALEFMRQELVEQEATKMIAYYNDLCHKSSEKLQKIEKHVEVIKYSSILPIPEQTSSVFSTHDCISEQNIDANKSEYTNNEYMETIPSNDSIVSSCSSYHTIPTQSSKDGDKNESLNKSDELETKNGDEELDLINANIKDEVVDNENGNVEIAIQTDKTKYDENIRMAIKNFEFAREIRKKVMSQEMGIDITNDDYKKKAIVQCSNLTAAMQNKLKVLNSEFSIECKPETLDIIKPKPLTALQINRNRILHSGGNFYGAIDNDNYVNKNVEVVPKIIKKSKSLILELNKPSKQELDKPTPMSVDSTPQSDLPQSLATTPASTLFDSIPTTAETQQTDDGFNFYQKPLECKSSTISSLPTKIFSKRVSVQEAAGISTNCLKLFLNESIMIPLVTQIKLVNNELLRYFLENLEYLGHLKNLRDFFFLQNGEFGRNITENLFEKLYDATSPLDLINCHTLHTLVFGALDISYSKSTEHTSRLSFKINTLPKDLDLGNPDFFDCLSLTYQVMWPMNILIPADTITKYDEVFKFLIKLNRMQWVLKRTFLEMKVLAKETGKKEIYLMSSPQYRKIHKCRHIMTHFIQTFQNYIVGEVLQSNWAIFEINILSAKNLDDLYINHTSYIKNIHFMCFLNQKCLIIRNVVHKIFVVILKFYEYLRIKCWKCENGLYIHPNFDKLESIFNNFEEFVRYFFKVCTKVAKCGYQAHLKQLLDMLDINGFYSKPKLNPS